MNNRFVILSCFLVAVTLSIPGYSQNQQQQPATLRSILLHELRTTHNQAEWFAPISAAVDGLSAEQARWQPPSGAHSAGQLTYHLLFWNRRALEKFQAKPEAKFSGNNDETFTNFDDKQWADVVKQLDQVMTDLEKLVESAGRAEARLHRADDCEYLYAQRLPCRADRLCAQTARLVESGKGREVGATHAHDNSCI